MPLVGFEPTIPMFERAKTVHALDRAATIKVLHTSKFCSAWTQVDQVLRYVFYCILTEDECYYRHIIVLFSIPQ
jgi:hypothetical protein